ncbi:MAG: FkbM family methyltransferase [Cyclobacteriaceae bacterium]
MNIKDRIKNFLYGYYGFKHTFSECGEDSILRRIFYEKIKKEEKGFYVDVGSFHPYYSSVTQLLSLEGWTGINIDPREGTKNLFDSKRKKDVNLEMAISSLDGEAKYYETEIAPSLNSISLERFDQLNIRDKITREVKVPCCRLDTLFDKYLDGENFDLLNIDVEGHDLKVLQSNNWVKYRPRVICVEIDGFSIQDILNSETYLFLKELGYEFVAKNYILPRISTCFFLDKKSPI